MSYSRKKHIVLFITIVGIFVLLMAAEFSYHNYKLSKQKSNQKLVEETLVSITYTYDHSQEDISKLLNLLENSYLSDQQLSSVYSVLASLYFTSAQTEKYLDTLGTALFYSQLIKDKDNCILLYTNLCKFLLQINATEQAFEILNKANSYFPIDQLNNPAISSIAWELLAEECIYRKDYNHALENMNKSNNVLQVLPDDSPYKFIYWKMGQIALAKIYFFKGDFSKASEIISTYENELENPSELEVQYNAWDFFMPIYFMKTNLELYNKNYDKAIENYQKYAELCNKYQFPAKKIELGMSLVDQLPPETGEIRNQIAYDIASTNLQVSEQFIKLFSTLAVYNIDSKINELTQKTTEYSNRNNLFYRIFINTFIVLILFVIISFFYNESRTDPLTKLLNRKAFNSKLDSFISKKIPYSVIMADIDDFKKVNDTFGHSFGDEVLQEISTILMQFTNKAVSCYRYGGEEIVFLIKNCNKSQVIRLAENIRIGVSSLLFENGAKVTVSLGVSFSTESQSPLEDADANMYYAKRHGKNFTAFTTASTVHLAERRIEIRNPNF